jgi:hypothetical protein
MFTNLSGQAGECRLHAEHCADNARLQSCRSGSARRTARAGRAPAEDQEPGGACGQTRGRGKLGWQAPATLR